MTQIRFRSDMHVQLIEHWGTDHKIAHAARTSTRGLDNQQGRVEGLVKALWRDGHYSPFEHCGATIAIEAPLFIAQQMTRHKSMSFSVQSGRYKEFEPEFYVPAEDRPIVQTGKALDYRREQGTAFQKRRTRHKHEIAADAAWDFYREMVLDVGIAPEVARNVLPASTYTSMWVTANLRSWLHFITQRADKHAQHEIREVAFQVENIIGAEFPIAWRAYEETRANSIDPGGNA